MRLIFVVFFIFQCLSLYSANFSVKLLSIITKDDMGSHLKVPTFVKFNNFSNRLCLIDSPKNRIIAYNENFFPIYSVGIGRGINKPVSIAFKNNKIYILTQKILGTYAKVDIFSSSWMKEREIILKDFKKEDIFYPISIAVNKKGDIYLVGHGREGILIFNKYGKYKSDITVKDSFFKSDKLKPVPFVDVFIDSTGKIFGLSEKMGRFYVFSKNNKFLFKGGTKGGSEHKLSRPRCIYADVENKLIYVVDYMRQIVQILDYNNGKYLYEFGGYGNSGGRFNYPGSLTIDSNGFLYVADTFNARVQVFEVIKK